MKKLDKILLKHLQIVDKAVTNHDSCFDNFAIES
jgi:hypothetical protein